MRDVGRLSKEHVIERDGMRIIAAPRDENDILAEERTRLSLWAPKNGWAYVEYADALDLLAQISALQSAIPQTVLEIEIIAHGNPALCDDVSLGNAAVVGESLRRIAGISPATDMYLSGCNTGLELNDDCIARSFATAFKAPVFGSRGYIVGTHAERTEQCVASFTLDGIVYHSYPGGVDAIGARVWNPFGPKSRSDDGNGMEIKIATSGFRPVRLEGEAQELLSAVEELIRTAPAQSARMRMAPDLTFSIRLEDGEHVFELLAGGTVLRDPVTRHVWQFERGREVLQSLLPYRKLPAA
jgi:hypothetical protein